MDHDSIETARLNALNSDKCFTRSRLHDEFRMKPRPDAAPVKIYKNRYGYRYGIYRIADCIPLRDQVKKPPTELQQRARAILALQARLRSATVQASGIARHWLDDNPLFLDTETTGLGEFAQIVELAIVDANGHVVFESRLRPTVPIEPGAMGVHGILEEDLTDAPQWPDVAPEIRTILSGRLVVIFNADFDTRLLRQTAEAFGDHETIERLIELNARCAMDLAADVYGATNRYGTISLANAAAAANLTWPGNAHSAIVDAQMTAKLVQTMSIRWSQLETERRKLNSGR